MDSSFNELPNVYGAMGSLQDLRASFRPQMEAASEGWTDDNRRQFDESVVHNMDGTLIDLQENLEREQYALNAIQNTLNLVEESVAVIKNPCGKNE